MALATMLYGSLGVALIAVASTARKVVEEDLQQVEFVRAPPKPEPQPVAQTQPEVAEPTPAPAPRPKVKRKRIKAPKDVPREAPKESDEPLAPPQEPPGPVDGFLDGVPGGTGIARTTRPRPKPQPQLQPKPKPPPPPSKVRVFPPVPSTRNRVPTYTPRARRLKLEGVVVATFVVGIDGSIEALRIVSGPDELGRIVLEVISGWRFKPALRDGKPVRYRKRVPVRFRLDRQ